jgi:4-phospho-D-threonate 3-dehydrogenase / 4-phospho-D-erythronate 3-dehydrogenase
MAVTGDRLPLVAVTMGDPAGIGPEIIMKALAAPDLYAVCRPLVVGDLGTLAKTARDLALSVQPAAVAAPRDGRYAHGAVDVLDLGNVDLSSLRMGVIHADAGRAAGQAVERAIRLAQAGEVDAIATAPLNKEALWAAGYPYPGHTEMLAELTGSRESLTMFVIGSLRIFFLTRHLSLRDAIAQMTRARVRETLAIMTQVLDDLGLASPRVAVAALNPHAGEGGKMGDEEIREIGPGVEDARAAGLDVSGPIPADSVFHLAAEGRFDAVLSLYHDQGHIAAKMSDFYKTVSVTTGLPFVRTSVDHGTAFDIAGAGRASAVSMIEAIRVAADLTARRRTKAAARGAVL